MNRRYVHLGINPFGSGTNAVPNLNSILESYLVQRADYYRYASQNYVLCTDANLVQLANEIKSLPGFQLTYIFLSELNLAAGYYGWMHPDFWRWLQGERKYQ